eukprot:TRINITY_DN13540_c0_g6_i1.p1 TRINITY_DN13540_c0_g6~~TRINITY_DN13540_c0_g6_i1.p1  ORF type:complete len:806 (-),score=177.16 TRINITY_DN13540_c0_g6_i1:345-2762(-)
MKDKKYLARASLTVGVIRRIMEIKNKWKKANKDFIQTEKMLIKKNMEQVKNLMLSLNGNQTFKKRFRAQIFEYMRLKATLKSTWIDLNPRADLIPIKGKTLKGFFSKVEKDGLKLRKELMEVHLREFRKSIYQDSDSHVGKTKSLVMDEDERRQKAEEQTRLDEKLLSNIQMTYISSLSPFPSRNVNGTNEETSEFSCQVAVTLKSEAPLVTLRRLTRMKEKGKKGVVNKMKKAQDAYSFLSNTKIANVEMSVILKAFGGPMWKGGVSKAKFEEVLCGLGITDFPVDLFFQLFGAHHTGIVDLKSILSGFNLIATGTPGEKLKLLFNAFDTNGDGMMDRDEMFNFLKMVLVSGAKMMDLMMGTVRENMKEVREDLGMSDKNKASSGSESEGSLSTSKTKSSLKPLKGLVSVKKQGNNKIASFSEFRSLRKIAADQREDRSSKQRTRSTQDDSSGETMKLSNTSNDGEGGKATNSAGGMVGVDSTTTAAEDDCEGGEGGEGGEGEGGEGVEGVEGGEGGEVDVKLPVSSVFSDMTIKMLVNLSFKLMKVGDQQSITYEQFEEFAKSEPLVANIFGFGRPVKKKEEKKKKKEKMPSILKIYTTFQHLQEQGGVTKRAFIQGLKTLKLNPHDFPVDTIFYLFDKENTGFIEFGDILVAISTILGGSADEKFNFVFAALDRDNSGTIDQTELFRFFKAVFLNSSKILHLISKVIKGHKSIKTLNSIRDALMKEMTIHHMVTFVFLQADKDGNGELSVDELKQYITVHHYCHCYHCNSYQPPLPLHMVPSLLSYCYHPHITGMGYVRTSY